MQTPRTRANIRRSGLVDQLDFVLSNLRLADLVAIVKTNKGFYDDFVVYLREQGYRTTQEFVNEPSDERGTRIIAGFLERTSRVELMNGLGNP
jgi:hypothetical protein